MVSIPEITDKFEEFSFVSQAGAAPTDIGNVPVWQLHLTDLVHLTDQNQQECEDILLEFSGHEGTISSKEVIDEDTEHETACFWVTAYDPMETFTKDNIEWDIVAWDDAGIIAIDTELLNPVSGFHRFAWDDVPFTQDHLESN